MAIQYLSTCKTSPAASSLSHCRDRESERSCTAAMGRWLGTWREAGKNRGERRQRQHVKCHCKQNEQFCLSLLQTILCSHHKFIHFYKYYTQSNNTYTQSKIKQTNYYKFHQIKYSCESQCSQCFSTCNWHKRSFEKPFYFKLFFHWIFIQLDRQKKSMSSQVALWKS